MASSEKSSSVSKQLDPSCIAAPVFDARCNSVAGSDSWVIMSANITSFNSQQDSLLELPFDIVAIQETRHTSKTQQGYSAFLKRMGSTLSGVSLSLFVLQNHPFIPALALMVDRAVLP